MKKRIMTVICILSAAALLVLNGCTDNNSSGSAKGSSADSSVSQTEASLKDESSKEEKKQDKQRSDADDDPEESESKTSADADTVKEMYSTVDYDLSVMSGTVVYAEVYNIVTDPDTYRGKTIKMTGNLATYHDDKTGMDYFACIIPDATACCSQGIEFRTTDSFRYPEDYPEIGKEITVIGTFDTYKEEPYEYPVLDQAVIV